jgi:AcrR family transcriptional regulator
MPKETFFNLPEDKRERILDIAVDEFAGKPYKVASISKIVRKAEIAKGSFYQYFENKKELYRYLLELGVAEKMALLRELTPPDPGMDIFGYMRWLFQATVHFELQRPRMAELAYRAFIEEIPFPKMTEELMRRGSTQFFGQLLSQGILHGDVAPWVDPNMAAFLMETIFYHFGQYLIRRLNLSREDLLEKRYSVFDNEEAQQLFSNLMDLLEAGMKRDPEQRTLYFNKS